MNQLSQDELKSLLGEHRGFCISIFLPTFRTGAESQQNQIRLRNLLRSAEESLLACGMRPQEIRNLMEPAQSLAGNVPFWRRQSDGLALFLSADTFRYFCLPEAFDELVVAVPGRFHVKPLLPLLGGGKRFYVLTLSQKEVRLLEGTGQSVRELELDKVPKSLDEALQYDEFGKQVRFRAGSTGGGDRSTMVSGHGAEVEDIKNSLLRYFRLIDRGIHDLLREEQAPLVLPGWSISSPSTGRPTPICVSWMRAFPGIPKGTSAEALHRSALKIVKPYFQKAEDDAVAQYRQSSGTGLASADIREIVPAAVHGRIGSSPGRPRPPAAGNI